MEGKYIFSIVLGVIGLLIILLNWFTRYHAYYVVPKMSKEEQEKRLGEPWIPIIGGLTIFFALRFIDAPVWLQFLPFILDWGCLPGFVYFIVCMIMARKNEERYHRGG